jgi:hypothetical protein
LAASANPHPFFRAEYIAAGADFWFFLQVVRGGRYQVNSPHLLSTYTWAHQSWSPSTFSAEL